MVQYQYPEQGWSTGKMRKRGEKLAMMPEADPTQTKGLMGAGSWPVQQVPQAPVSKGLLQKAKEAMTGATEKAQAAEQYETKLTPAEETAFKKWKQKHAPNDSGADYDLRGAFRSGLKPDPETGHWPDTFKKPNHPTFSDQSIYAKDRPDLAGRWEGETYVPAGGQ